MKDNVYHYRIRRASHLIRRRLRRTIRELQDTPDEELQWLRRLLCDCETVIDSLADQLAQKEKK